MPDGTARHGPADRLIAPESLAALYGVPMRLVALSGPGGERRRAVLPAFAGQAA